MKAPLLKPLCKTRFFYRYFRENPGKAFSLFCNTQYNYIGARAYKAGQFYAPPFKGWTK